MLPFLEYNIFGYSFSPRQADSLCCPPSQMLKDPETVLERVVRFLGQDPGLLKPVPAVRPVGTWRMCDGAGNSGQ